MDGIVTRAAIRGAALITSAAQRPRCGTSTATRSDRAAGLTGTRSSAKSGSAAMAAKLIRSVYAVVLYILIIVATLEDLLR